MKTLSFCVVLVALLAGSGCQGAVYTEEELAAYLSGPFETISEDIYFKQAVAEWDLDTDLSNVTKKAALAEQDLIVAKFEKDQWEEYFRDADWENFKTDIVKRQVQLLSVLGVAALPEAQLAERNRHLTTMKGVYSTAKICPYDNQQCDLASEGSGMQEVMSNSTDYDELTYVWKAWRDASGAKMREDYKGYVDLSNQAAVLNGFPDMGAMWRADYETDTFVADMAAVWEEVEPLYVSLHTYVHSKLVERYGDLLLPNDGLIPAQVLGNMWAQSWGNLYDLVVPYPGESVVDVTDELNEQGYTVLRMFETSNDFFKSLGLLDNSMSYDTSLGAMIEPPDDREVAYRAACYDFCDRNTFRIKMCTNINSEDFITIHHELAHIQYYQQYKDQPITLRHEANPGFQDAIGNTIALSVRTPQHLRKIGLLGNFMESEGAGINALMAIALDKVALLPFVYLVDQWRWDVFSGAVPESQWNAHWWSLRERIQRVRAPVPRTENDFDPGAKYHISGDVEYMQYFVAHILQFQLHKAACIAAGQYNPDDVNSAPLHQCDIFTSQEAGTLLANGLKLGASRHWTEVLQVMTGETELNGSALLEYFAPLQEWLDQQNNAPGVAVHTEQPF